MDRILNMIVNRVIRQFVNRGVDAGIDRVTRGRGDSLTPEQEAQARQTAQRGKQGLRMARRIGRF